MSRVKCFDQANNIVTLAQARVQQSQCHRHDGHTGCSPSLPWEQALNGHYGHQSIHFCSNGLFEGPCCDKLDDA